MLDKKYFKPQYWELKHRLFKAKGGFGMLSETMGCAIYGTFIEDGEECRQDGDIISKAETETWQAEHGKFGELKP